ncbi:MAG: hydrogen peroxide-inducible genes activator [Pseudomonadota bacterium]
MIGLTMKHLRYLVAVADCGHFGNAAAKCFISQPALSQQIKELEALIGEKLIERSARRVALTPLGEQAVERARDILNSVQDFGDFIKASRETFAGDLRFGIIPTIAPYVLPQIVKTLGTAYPGLVMRPREAITPQLIDGLAQSQLDIALVALPLNEPSLEELKLFDEEFVLVRRIEAANEPVPHPKDLIKMKLLLLEEGHCFREQAISFCNLNERKLHEFMEASSLSTLVQMVEAGIGITVIPEMALPLETRSGKISVSRFKDPAPKRSVGLAWRESNPLAGTFTEISAILKTQCFGVNAS